MSDAEDPAREQERPTAFNSADPPRNFSLTVGDRIRALTIGAPAYAARKKHIEDLEAAHIRTLIMLHDGLVARGRDAAAASHALHERAATLPLGRLNTLIATHNRYYPIEADLPVDPRTGEYVIYGNRWLPTDTWTVTRLVQHVLATIAARGEP